MPEGSGTYGEDDPGYGSGAAGGAYGGAGLGGNSGGYGSGALADVPSYGYTPIDPNTGQPIDTTKWTDADWKAWNNAAQADYGVAVAGIVKEAYETTNPSWVAWSKAIVGALVEVVGILATGPIGLAKTLASLARDENFYTAIRDAVTYGATMKEAVKAKVLNSTTLTDAEFESAWSKMEAENESIKALGSITSTDGQISVPDETNSWAQNTVEGSDAGGGADTMTGQVAGAGADTTGSGQTDATAVPSTASIPDQMTGMFVGEDPLFSIPGMTQDYVTGVGDAFTDYTQAATGIEDSWESFEQKYSSLGVSVLEDYDAVKTRYEENMASIPGLGVKVPDYMGGATVPLAPGAWGNYYGQQARTEAGLVGEQADYIPHMAGIESTGISNRQNLNQNRLMNAMSALQAGNLPLDIALKLGRDEQQFRYGQSLADASQPDEPKWYESVIPAVGYAAGQGAFDDLYKLGQEVASWF